ncbi:MAG: patatin-like phospholipase family protein, partial [Bacillota bacterium]
LIEVDYGEESYLIEDYNRFLNLEDKEIGLALTGGGATGFFNIGVIKALVEEDIKVDLLVGSSMGSIIATMYGSGLPIEEVEDIIIKTPFSKMFDFNISSRESILKTAKVNKFIERVATEKDLENFPISTALLSLDLNNGKKYLITSGKISEVMQGSYAIPMYFPIHYHNNRYLADPGVVENSPAKATKVLGADFVIATSIGGEVNTENKNYNTPTKAASRYLEVVQNLTSSKLTENYADIIIEPDLSDFGFMDYNSAEELIEIGYRHTKKMMPDIKEKLIAKNISFEKNKKRENFDFTKEYRDLKYDRFLIDQSDLKPAVYYGKNYSVFNEKLAKSNKDSILYGLEFNKNHFDLSFLVNEIREESFLQLRLRKLTDDFDLVNKFKISDGYIDYQSALKYLNNDYTIEGGLGKIDDENYLFMKSNFQLNLSDYLIDTENAIYYKINSNDFAFLSTLNTRSELTKTWDIEPSLVYNNSNLVSSPIIYRGSEINNKKNLQISIDYLYTHRFIDDIDFLDLFELQDVSLYLFTDYRYDNGNPEENIVYGLGSKSNFYLLGLKPFDFEVFYSFEDQGKNNNFGIRFDYDF